MEGNVAKREGVIVPGGRLSVEEARRRVSKLVEGEEPAGAESMGATKEKVYLEEEETGQDSESQIVSETVDVSAPGSPSSDQSTDQPTQASDDGGLLTEEESKKAQKASFTEAIKWLAAWLKRQKEKLQF